MNRSAGNLSLSSSNPGHDVHVSLIVNVCFQRSWLGLALHSSELFILISPGGTDVFLAFPPGNHLNVTQRLISPLGSPNLMLFSSNIVGPNCQIMDDEGAISWDGSTGTGEEWGRVLSMDLLLRTSLMFHPCSRLITASAASNFLTNMS